VAKATGIGPALRKARLQRGKSIGEASRETRIRAEYLQALERERFDGLLGDVYVRGFLRTYAGYLGLDSDKVAAIYAAHFGPPAPPAAAPPSAPPMTPSPPPTSRLQRRRMTLPALRGRGLSWPVLVVAAVIVVGSLATAGLFSPSKTAPQPTAGAIVPVVGGGPDAVVTLAVEASVDVRTQVSVDGSVAFDRVLRAGEGQSFQGDRTIVLALDQGGTALVTVNGFSLGSPGSAGSPYSATYHPTDFRSQPSPGPSVG
jgi:hypothetical protein